MNSYHSNVFEIRINNIRVRLTLMADVCENGQHPCDDLAFCTFDGEKAHCLCFVGLIGDGRYCSGKFCFY